MISKNLRLYIFLFVLCLPLFFINIRNSHDWGDDFAQYIYQAKNIVQGVPQSEPCYIFDNPNFSSPTNSIGFPLILAPVYYLFGNNIIAFSILITGILFCLCFALFIFFRKHFTNLISVLLVLIFVYNPYTLNFKMEIMTDIPFAFLLLITILTYRRINKEKIINYILIGILAGFLISIRSIGISVITAISLDRFISYLRLIREKSGAQYKARKEFVKPFIQIFIFLISSSCFFLLLNVVIFKVPGGGILRYSHDFMLRNSGRMFLENILFYLTCFQNYFMSGINSIPLIPHITQFLILSLMLVGFIKKCMKKVELTELVLLCYLSIIFIYPNKTLIVGMRLLFPVFPFFLYYAVLGLQLIKLKLKIYKNIISFLLGLFVLLPYSLSILNIMKHQHETLHGPQEPESTEAFNYIKNNTPSNAIFVFFRARTIALYTGRKATYSWYWTYEHENEEQLDERFKTTGVNYILINSDLEDIGSERYMKKYPDKVQLIWQNAKFKLFSLKS